MPSATYCASRHRRTGRPRAWTMDLRPCAGSMRRSSTSNIGPWPRPRAPRSGQWRGHPRGARSRPPWRASRRWPCGPAAATRTTAPPGWPP
eukprot:1240335-Alexandrium_andersonii.AAC.1